MNSERFTLPVDEYLALEHVPFYIEDALSQLLEHKEEYTQFGIVRFFADYFNSVRNGNHILFREFSFVKATPHNRSSFLHAFWRCFRQIGKNGENWSWIKELDRCTWKTRRSFGSSLLLKFPQA